MKRTIVTFGLLHLGIFVSFTVVAIMYYPATGEFERSIALRLLEGQLPYRDFTLEYPPLTLIAFLLPALFFRSSFAYAFGFALELLIFDLIILWLVAVMAYRCRLSVVGSLTVYTLFLVAVGPLIVCRYDLFPAMLVMASVWSFTSGRTSLAWALMALGFATKIYPVIVVPFYLVHQLLRRQYTAVFAGLAVFAGALAVTVVPWLLIDHRGLWYSMTYHLERGLHAESSYGTMLMLAQVLGWTSTEGSLSFGSWNLTSPLADAMAALSSYLVLSLLLAVYVAYVWHSRHVLKTGSRQSEDTVPSFMRFVLLAHLVFLLANKVFSAQYLIWLCPWLPLLVGWGNRTVWVLCLVAAGLTQYVFPYNYVDFELVRPLPVVLLAVRNLLLLAVAGACGYGLFKGGNVSLPRQ